MKLQVVRQHSFFTLLEDVSSSHKVYDYSHAASQDLQTPINAYSSMCKKALVTAAQ